MLDVCPGDWFRRPLKSSRSLSTTGIVPPPPPVNTASSTLPISGRFSKSSRRLSMTGVVVPPLVKTFLTPSTSNPKRLFYEIPEKTIWSGKRRKSSGKPMPSTQATSSQDPPAPLPAVPLRPAEPLGPPPWLRELRGRKHARTRMDCSTSFMQTTSTIPRSAWTWPKDIVVFMMY